MNNRMLHKFIQNGLHIVLDINSGAVHVVDEITYRVLDVFTGSNDDEVLSVFSGDYSESDLREVLDELHQLISDEKLFSAEPGVPPVIQGEPLVKSLCLHISHDCNLRCEYCFAGTGAFGHDRSLMSKEVGERAVDFIIAHSGHRQHCELDFFGGEPLLNMDTVRHVVSYVRNREAETGKIFKLTLTTNATLLDDQTIAYLNENNISLVLSLDGRPQVHDRMRPCIDGSGSYEETMANIRKTVVSRNDQNYYIRGTYTANNLDFAADVAWMAEQGFTQLSVEPVVAKDSEYALTEAHLPELFRQYDILTDYYLQRRAEGKPFNFFHFNLDINHGPCLAKRLSGCGAGHEYFAVTPDGDLYPCHQFVGRDEYLVGNIFDGVKKNDLVKKFRQAHVLNKPACRECWARFYCSGGCHANAQLLGGDLDTPYEIGCELQRKRLECAILIQALTLLQEKEAAAAKI